MALEKEIEKLVAVKAETNKILKEIVENVQTK